MISVREGRFVRRTANQCVSRGMYQLYHLNIYTYGQQCDNYQ